MILGRKNKKKFIAYLTAVLMSSLAVMPALTQNVDNHVSAEEITEEITDEEISPEEDIVDDEEPTDSSSEDDPIDEDDSENEQLEEEIPEGFIPIYTIEDLYSIRNDVYNNRFNYNSYILMNDIDMTEATAPGGDWDIGGTGWEPIDVEFDGTFDGNGHAIIGMNIHGDVKYKNVGLFGTFGCSIGAITNLKMIDVNIDIDIKTDEYVEKYIGVIAGYSFCGVIDNCFVSGNIKVSGKGKPFVGGFLGFSQGSDCIYNCYAANIESNYLAGGIFGIDSRSNSTFKLINCYNTGNIVSTRDTEYKYEWQNAIANIQGYSGDHDVEHCYYLKGSCEGQESKAGEIAEMSVAQMKSPGAFTNWDFNETWIIDSTSSYKYPQLRSCMQIPVTSVKWVSEPAKNTYVKGRVYPKICVNLRSSV